MPDLGLKKVTIFIVISRVIRYNGEQLFRLAQKNILTLRLKYGNYRNIG